MIPTDYCSTVIYESGIMKRILTPEGYLTSNLKIVTEPGVLGYPDGEGPVDMKDVLAETLPELDLYGDEERSIIIPAHIGEITKPVEPGGTIPLYSFKHHYFINDYLGNVRAVLTWDNSANYTVTQRNDYYAFGLPASNSVNPEAQPYKREGKEYDEMHGLNWADFHTRHFDFALPSSPTMDWHAENYYSTSPYALYGNNPVNRIDPLGMDWYEDKNGNAMWRSISDETYTDDDENVWTNVGTSRVETFGNITLSFTQKEDDEGNLILKTFGSIEENGVPYVYDLDTGMRGSPLGEKSLENVYPEFDILAIGRGIFNMVAGAIRGSATQTTSNLAKTPVSRSGNPMSSVAKNSPTTIEGTKFTAHALDQMQARGILSPSVVLDVIKNPALKFPGKSSGTMVL